MPPSDRAESGKCLQSPRWTKGFRKSDPYLGEININLESNLSLLLPKKSEAL